MADKSFGLKQVNLINASGTPRIESPNNLNINAVNVAISTDITVGGMVSLGTGTSISSPATNVLTFGTNSLERVRIASTGNVGIGTTAGAASSNTKLTLQTTDSSACRLVLANNGSSTPESTQIWSQNNELVFNAGGSEQARITANGLKLPSAKGIDFSATSDASGKTSELLDDYEEGTWTPTLNGFTNAGIFQTAEYIKIGRKVTVYLNIFQSSNNMSFTATSLISDLPFTTIANFHTAVSAVAIDVSENTDIIAAWLSPTTPVVKLKTASSSRRHILLQVSYYANA